MFAVNKIAILALLFSTAASASGPAWHETLGAALEQSRKTTNPILVDFQAPWCYSCYFMEQKVLNQPAFQSAAKDLVLLKLDVDTPEGRALKEKYKVTFLPSYVLLGADEKPLGRIIGEQTEKDFLAKLAALRGPGASPAERALGALRQRLAAGEYAAARKDIAALPRDLAMLLGADPAWRVLKARLALMTAVEKSGKGGLDSFKELLEMEGGCELAYDVYYAQKLLKDLPSAEKKAWAELQKTALERLTDAKVFAGACADFRTAVESLAGTYEQLGLAEKRQALLTRAIAYLDGAQVGADRNRDDNLRYFLQLAKEDARLKRLYPELVKAYETDYVYPYRFARYLLENGQAAEALPWIEKADRLCYGANRLTVTKFRAKILAALGRKDEAVALLKREIKAGKSFASDVKDLKAVLKSL